MILVARLVSFAVLLQACEIFAIRRGPLAAVTALAALVALVHPHPAPIAIMLVGTWGTAWCFRGTFNGGSDSMTVLLLLACLIALTAPDAAPAALTFTAVLVTWTYVVAGFSKLARRDWRSGRAVADLFTRSPFVYDRWLPVAPRTAAWAIMAFECTFPLAFAGPRAALAFLAAGVLFHALNVYYFGLNRFFWIWTAAYPAVFLVTSAGPV